MTFAMTIPDVEQRPLGPQTEPTITPEVFIVHTMDGYLLGTEAMFRHGGYDGTESTFGLGGSWDAAALDGHTYQWQDMLRQADAQFAGNAYANSCECSDGGNPNRPFSSKQLVELVRLGVAFCRQTGRKPFLVNATGPLGPGAFGYHSLRRDWNRDYHECPGAVRVAQLRQIVIPKIRAILAGTTAPKPVVHTVPGAHLPVDGIFGTGTISVLQHVLTAHRFGTGGIDGVFGPPTRIALQKWLAREGFYHGPADGVVGPVTVKALRAYLAAKGFVAVAATQTAAGLLDHMLVRRWQDALNAGRF